MKGIFSKSGYSSNIQSILLGVAKDTYHADILIKELQDKFNGVIFFAEDIDVNTLSNRVMRHYQYVGGKQ